MLYSTGTCSGIIIALTSYNKFKTNIYRNTIVVVLADTFTSIFAGFVIFSVLGFMAKEKGVPVSDVAVEGIIASILSLALAFQI